MKVEYSNRALADLRNVSSDSRRIFGDRVAAAREARIRAWVSARLTAPDYGYTGYT